MPGGRRPATDESDARVRRLADVLAQRKEERGWSLQDLANESAVHYETLRTLLAPAKPGRKRQGPSFFLVADVAAALKIPLKKLDEVSR